MEENYNALENFKERLATSITFFKKESFNAIWLKLSTSEVHLAQVALDQGFVMHHAMPDSLQLTLWMGSGPCKIPSFSTHNIGVGCIVFHPADKEKMLLVKEQKGTLANMWKVPTGLIDKGEFLDAGVEREVAEETNVRVKFSGVV